jgi:hypothetical protein
MSDQDGIARIQEPPDAGDCRLLPMDRTFGQILVPFALPYFAYVGLGALHTRFVPPEAVGILRFLLVAAILWLFRKQYRFGPALTPRLVLIALGAGLAATAVWVLALRFSLALPFWRSHLVESPASGASQLTWLLRAASSTLLVPIFEELFCRAYLGEFFHQVPQGAGSFTSRLAQRWDHYPEPIPGPPLSVLSVAGCTLLFALGHDVSAWAAAILYFLFTTWVYARTKSFRVCVIIHAVANLAIALMVLRLPDMRFLWN